MKLETTIEGRTAILRATGRLDAAWAEHLHTAVREVIREGHHEVRIHAAGIDYVSSAGIRALLKVQRELAALKGSFGLIEASSFVASTLEMSGLQLLLVTSSAVAPAGATATEAPGIRIELHTLDLHAQLKVHVGDAWKPWQPVQDANISQLAFPQSVFGLGIGAPGNDAADARQRMGEFVAAAGCLAWLPGDGSDVPDYLEQAERFVPRVHAIQSLQGEGFFSHLVRFQPAAKGDFLNLSDLLRHAFQATNADAIALLALAEVEGLVGASLCRSPGLIAPNDHPAVFPEIRNWLAFCGERLHRQTQALVVAFATRTAQHPLTAHLQPLPSAPEIHAHAHALVLPYRSIQQGVLDYIPAVRAAFQESEPIHLLHLLEDDRPAVGLGQSAFIRGACWCGPVREVTP